jgi:hypothetical protein
MGRTYPPIWCSEKECNNCDFINCDQKVLHLFEPYQYPDIDFSDRPNIISSSTIGVYFGYCEQLARFLLKFPQIGPMSVVSDNFYCSKDDLPARVEIPRIFLDMLTHGVDLAPTDEVHKLKLMLGMKELNSTNAKLGIGDEDKVITVSQKEIDAFYVEANNWTRKILENKNVPFKMTSDLGKCKYCFLSNCDTI